jgi:predicted RNase H-like nuclease (RuvC/YqgF family)
MIDAFKWFTGAESTKSVDKIGKGFDATTKAAAGGGQVDTTMFDTANKELTIAEKEQASIAKQIANQETMIQELEKQNSQLAPLPQALGKGTTAQISFLNNFKRQSKQDQILKKHNQEIENQKEQLEVMKKQLKVAEDAVKDKKETVSLLSITQ